MEKRDIVIALAGNPNSGKTTLFNELTGSHQYVGNWPGVTVERKTGEYKKNTDIKITDLPGIYSLSPYTLEEVVTRDYLINEKPDVIVDVIDASNLERNLYLATQLSELGIPLVLALNMMDIVEKNNDQIDIKFLEEKLGAEIVKISALKNKNVDDLVNVAIAAAEEKIHYRNMKTFSDELEADIKTIENTVKAIENEPAKRFVAIKLFEKDKKINFSNQVTADEQKIIDDIIEKSELKYDDDTEGIITDERYNFVTSLTDVAYKRGRDGETISEKIDEVVTSRIFSIPIFAAIMTFIYFISINVVGGPITDWVNDVFIGETVMGGVSNFLEAQGVSEALRSLVVDGIIGGVGGVLGFLPIIATLFLFIAILEDVGYMSRIAFILDKIFRKFGLSGKSFIPILIGTGCSVPGIVGTRTIENDADRRMTITIASMMPCGAKTDIIAMFAAVFGGSFWFGPIWYFGGIIAIIISGIILKKMRMFNSDPSPFVMELPEYHLPSIKNVSKATWFRVKSFIIKAGTVILLSSILIWVLQNITVDFQFQPYGEQTSQSLLSFMGEKVAWIFVPLGFGDWMSTVATVLGLVAKEMVVSTFGVLANLGDIETNTNALTSFVQNRFTIATMLSFMFFNQFTIPCFAAVGAIRQEMGSRKWFLFAIGYILIFSYTLTMMIYQFSRVLIDKEPANIMTYISLGILGIYLFLLFRKNKNIQR